MPYKLKKMKNGYYVENIKTKEKFSKKPIPKSNAIKQKYVLELIDKNKNKK